MFKEDETKKNNIGYTFRNVIGLFEIDYEFVI